MSDSKALSLVRRALPSLLGGLRAPQPLTSMVHSGAPRFGTWFGGLFQEFLPSSKRDYSKRVGDGLKSSVLAGPINFLLRTFPEAPPIVERMDADGSWKHEKTHPLQRLLRRPNPFYNGRTLSQVTALDLEFGTAHWLKIRNRDGKPIQLWWVPRQSMVPRYPTDGSVFISHWDYYAGNGNPTPIDPNDVVTFRFGLDPKEPRLGLSPLGSLMREIAVDDEAANFTFSVLERLGVIGVVVSPKEKGMEVKAGTLDEVKEYIRKNFTGDNRGDALALSMPTDVKLLQYNLQGFDVGPIRDVSEERVTAAMGFPAAVIGFGTGLQQTKVGATMREMRQLAWTGGIIPLQEIIAEQVGFSLLPEWDERAAEDETIRMRYDTSKVRALWEDTNEKHMRVREDFKAKVIDLGEARQETGRAVREEDKGVYYGGPPSPETNPPKPDDDDEEEDVETDEGKKKPPKAVDPDDDTDKTEDPQ